MNGLDELLSSTISRHIKAEAAIHIGDPEQRLKMLSKNDPVTLFGAWGYPPGGSKSSSRDFGEINTTSYI